MAELKMIYDDGFGKKTERTITSFRDPRTDYSDCQDEPTWPAIFKEMWDFINDLGFIINEKQCIIIDRFLENGDLDLGEFLDEAPTDEEPRDENPCDCGECDAECAKCGLKDTCDTRNSDECPMSAEKSYDEMAESGVIAPADKAEIRETIDKPKEDETPQPDSLLPLPIGQKLNLIKLNKPIVAGTRRIYADGTMGKPHFDLIHNPTNKKLTIDHETGEVPSREELVAHFLNACDLTKEQESAFRRLLKE